MRTQGLAVLRGVFLPTSRTGPAASLLKPAGWPAIVTRGAAAVSSPLPVPELEPEALAKLLKDKAQGLLVLDVRMPEVGVR